MSNDVLDEDNEADQSEEIGSENGLNMSIFVPILIPEEESNIKVWLLNQKQRHVSNIVHDWVGRHIKIYILYSQFPLIHFILSLLLMLAVANPF